MRAVFLTAVLVCGPSQAAQLLRGPYLQIPTPDSITIRWRTDLPTESVVHYGLQTNDLALSASNLVLTNEHIVALSSLAPATTYYYSVGSSTQTLAAGIDYTFKTSPAAGNVGPTRVWAFGDSGGVTLGYTNVFTMRDAYLQYAGSRPADVWLTLGDLAYEIGSDPEFQTNYFDVFADILRKSAAWPTIGNHEAYSAPPGQRFPYLDIFSFPTNGQAGGVASGSECYYSFNHANVHFICLDSQTQSRATNGVMANWLRSDLAANTNQWVIAFWHHPPYSKGGHDSDAFYEVEMIEMRQNIVPILEAGGVDLVLNGHSHDYERSYPLHGHYGYSTNLSPEMILDRGTGRESETGAYTKPTLGPLANRGTVYVGAGTGCCMEPRFGHHPVMFMEESQLGSLILEINSNRLDAVFLRETGVIDDSFTIIKEDPRLLAWTGMADSTTWDLDKNNWSNAVAQLNGDSYHIGDMVRFDDATTNRAVTLTGLLTPSSTTVDTTNTFAFTGPGSLGGPTGLAKKGVGTLWVGTSNDYSGVTTISNGTLSVCGGKAIGDSSAVIIANVAKAALVITNGEIIGSLAGGGTAGGNVILNGGILTTGGNGNSTAYAANISGMGSLSKRGDGTMTLTGFVLLLGSLWVNSGTLAVDASGSVSTFNYQSIGASAGDNGRLTLKGSSTYAVANDFNLGEAGDSVGTLTVNNNAILTVTRLFVGAANESGSTASGMVNQTGGTVTETSPSLGDFIIGGRNPNSTNGVGVYNLRGGALLANAAVSVGGWGSGTVNQSGGTFTAASPDGGVVLQHYPGPGGTYNLNGGTLKTFGIATGVDSSDPSFNSVFNFNGGTLQPTENNNAFMQGLSRVNVRDGGAVIDTAGFEVTISQPLLQSDIAGDVGTGGLIKNGIGKLTLSGANTYSGGTLLAGGELSISAEGNLGLSTDWLSISNGAILRNTANLILSSTRQILLGPPSGTVQPDGSRVSAIIDVAAGTTADIRSRILGTNDIGTARLMKTGDGLLFLNNLDFNNTFGGGIYLHGGLTKTAPGPQFADSDLTQDQGAKLVSNQDGVFNSRSHIGIGGAVRESDLGYTVYRNGPILNVNNVTNFGGLTLQGDETAGNPSQHAGKAGLGGTNTFGGSGQAIVVNTNFTLSICQDVNLGSLANKLVLNGCTLAVEHGAASDGTGPAVAVVAAVNTARQIDISGNVTIFVSDQSDSKNTPVAAGNNGILGQMTVSGSVANGPAGPGDLTKTGVGTLTLSGANSYTGNTTVNAGVLDFSQPTLHSNATVTVANGAILRLDFAATNRVAKLVLNGVNKAPGTYNSGNSSPYIAGTGSLSVTSPAPVNLAHSVSGNILSLSWPAGQNWTLQAQTNNLTIGLNNDWVDVPGSTGISSTNITIDATQPATFYRLKQ